VTDKQKYANAAAVKTATAWESIGFDEGLFRIKGGRALYEAVMYNCANDGRLVKLARLEDGPREVSRYVDPDTVLEFVVIYPIQLL
jgi:hypothetical protein